MTYMIRVVPDGPGVQLAGYTEFVEPDDVDPPLPTEFGRRFKRLAAIAITGFAEIHDRYQYADPESLIVFVDIVPGTGAMPGTSPADAGQSPAEDEPG